MKGYIDLHTHTTASDGTLTPAEIVRHAKTEGLSAIAITDHDTVSGIQEAMEEAKNIGFEVVPGVELDVNCDTEMHILGYYVDANSQEFKNVLDDLNKKRNKRNLELVDRLNSLGISITIEDITNEAKGNVVSRAHVAKAMVVKGFAKNVQEAFERFLKFGKPAYMPKDKLNPQDGIKLIKDAGGVAVLAHPLYIVSDIEKLDSLFGELKEMGLAGIEAYYTTHSYEETGNLLRLALKHQLIVTGGSDFHGGNKPDISIGTGFGNLKIEYALLEKLRERLK